MREFFLKKLKTGINEFLLSLRSISELKKNLMKSFRIMKKRKKFKQKN